MRNRFMRTTAAAIAALGMVQPALAVLDSVGPIDPVHGYPAWYMDRNGLALELCVNTNATVLAAGGCVIVSAAPPGGVLTVPEIMPSNWAMEHFYALATMVLTTAGVDANGAPLAGAGKVTLGMGIEGSFATPTPVAGQQIVFNRWRVNHFNAPCTGNYTYYTPNNVPQTFFAASSGRVFETSDIGVGTVTGPLAGTTGPFLLWSATPGGVAKAPFTGPDGKRYISNYNVAAGTAVTGSALANPLLASTKTWIPADIKAMKLSNYILVEGPGIATGNCAATESVSSSDSFQLFGRYFDGGIPSPTKVDRATFTAVDTNADGTPDTFQIGVWAQGQQKAGAASPIMGMALVTGDPLNPTVVSAETVMTRFQLGTTVPGVLPKFEYFQTVTTPKPLIGAPTVLARPAAGSVRVRVTSEVPPTVLNVPLVDELNINSAVWDSSLKTLTVMAESGAFLSAVSPVSQTASNVDCSIPCLTLDNLSLPALASDGVTRIDYKLKSQGSKYAVMKAVIPNVEVPPDSVSVVSSMGGRDTQPVMYSGIAVGSGIALADTASTPMNVAVTIPVLLNDVGVSATPALQICTAATGGTCAVPAPATACVLNTASPQCTVSGGRITITASNDVSFTPKLNVGGTSETFWYQVATATGLVRAPVTVAVGSISGLPDARDDLGIVAVVNKLAVINVLVNDFAPAGIDLSTLKLLSGPCLAPANVTCTPASVSFDAQGRLVFTPTAAGTWTLQYTFTDVLGQLADPGVVNVSAVTSETLILGKALFKTSKIAGVLGNIVVDGTSSVALSHTLELRLPNAATGPQGCNNPTAGAKVAVTTVGSTGAWAFAATALAVQPSSVYVYSPAFGGCLQAVASIK